MLSDIQYDTSGLNTGFRRTGKKEVMLAKSCNRWSLLQGQLSLAHPNRQHHADPSIKPSNNQQSTNQPWKPDTPG
jgi:hypothetical protein